MVVEDVNNQTIPEVKEAGQAEIAPSTETGQEEMTDNTAVGTEIEDEFLAKADPRNIKDPTAKKLVENLVADYTRKMQGVSDYRKKSEVLDNLIIRPDFVEWAKSRKEAEEKAASEAEIVDTSQMTEDQRAKFYRDRFENQILLKVDKKIEPIRSELEQSKNMLITKEAEGVAKAFYAKYPDAKKQGSEIADLVRKGHDLEEAWDFVKYKKSPEQSLNQARVELQAKKDSNLLTVTDKNSPTKRTDKKYSSTMEATKATMDELGL